MRILLVEDERRAAEYLAKGLGEHGYSVDRADDGETGLRMALRAPYDLIILDVLLPSRDGWSVIAELRREGRETPVIFLSARDALEDRVRGLELGADDYLTKPFAFAELLARVRTILRRGPSRQPEVLRVGDLELHAAEHRATRGGAALQLTPKEFALLDLFVRHRGEVLSRTYIADRVWGINFDSGTNVIDVHVRRLRAKVDEPFARPLIHTVWGVGYRFDAE